MRCILFSTSREECCDIPYLPGPSLWPLLFKQCEKVPATTCCRLCGSTWECATRCRAARPWLSLTSWPWRCVVVVWKSEAQMLFCLLIGVRHHLFELFTREIFASGQVFKWYPCTGSLLVKRDVWNSFEHFRHQAFFLWVNIFVLVDPHALLVHRQGKR